MFYSFIACFCLIVLFIVAALQQKSNERPWMVVERSIMIAATELVDEHTKPRETKDNPSYKKGVRLWSDDSFFKKFTR